MLETIRDNIKLELKEIEVESGLGPITYEQESVSKTNKITSITEDTAIRNIECKDLLEKRLIIIQCKLKRIENVLNMLQGIDREVIEQRYIKNEAWFNISLETSVCERTCRRIEKRVINRLARWFYEEAYF